MRVTDLGSVQAAANVLKESGWPNLGADVETAIAELRATRELLACATEFEISERITVSKRDAKDAARWAVLRDQHFCLNKDGEWEYEPLPSSRDDAFIARCRFDTLAEAIAAMRAAVEKARKAC